MRNNFLGETIFQSSDEIDVVRARLEDQSFTPMSADISQVRDDNYAFGGELRDSDGNGIGFDGFDSVDAAKAFAANFVDAEDVDVLDQDEPAEPEADTDSDDD